MITISDSSISDQLSIEETISRLKASPLVDGIAAFGSRTTLQMNPTSDYDLLVLVKDIPVPVFQLVTTISNRLADVVLVPIETADTLLSTAEQPKPRSFEALFVQKMKTAHILYDASARLQKVNQLVTSQIWKDGASTVQSDSDGYIAWFWQSFGLLHLERMAQSQDTTHLSAVDMMLTSCLPGTWRSYFDIRQVPWEGEKAAIRYWANIDPAYLQAIRACLEVTDRNQKLALYRKIVEQTIEPLGKPFPKGETAAILMGSNHVEDIVKSLKFWRALFNT